MTGIEHFCPAVIVAELRAIAVKKIPKNDPEEFFYKKTLGAFTMAGEEESFASGDFVVRSGAHHSGEGAAGAVAFNPGEEDLNFH
ncbi:MAG: hypothetical protein RL077_2657 [Verrucomicrobiota bacterium]|jgi:homoaconitase/3-isopropylmalate dehydratase large subunit